MLTVFLEESGPLPTKEEYQTWVQKMKELGRYSEGMKPYNREKWMVCCRVGQSGAVSAYFHVNSNAPFCLPTSLGVCKRVYSEGKTIRKGKRSGGEYEVDRGVTHCRAFGNSFHLSRERSRKGLHELSELTRRTIPSRRSIQFLRRSRPRLYI